MANRDTKTNMKLMKNTKRLITTEIGVEKEFMKLELWKKIERGHGDKYK